MSQYYHCKLTFEGPAPQQQTKAQLLTLFKSHLYSIKQELSNADAEWDGGDVEINTIDEAQYELYKGAEQISILFEDGQQCASYYIKTDDRQRIDEVLSNRCVFSRADISPSTTKFANFHGNKTPVDQNHQAKGRISQEQPQSSSSASRCGI